MKKHWQVFPKAFLNRLKEYLPPKEREIVLKGLCRIKPTTFRVNTLRTTKDFIQNELNQLNIPLANLPWYQDAFILNTESHLLTQTDLYKQGLIYLQSLSSMLPPLILHPKRGEKVLDLCAAPGSKTTQMAALMENTGLIIANDKSPIRLQKLNANLVLLGVTNTKLTQMPGQLLWQQYSQYFDKALVDPPCSLEGRFNCRDPKSYKNWNLSSNKYFAEQQKFLLRSAISATKPGGEIVYSTCTLSPEENEAVVDWVLKKEKGKIELKKIKIEHFSFVNGFTKWRQKVFDPSLAKTVRIYPSETFEGFFIAKIKKLNIHVI